MDRIAFWIVVAFISTSSPVSAATIYTVGTSNGCTHATLQAAVNAAQASPDTDFIRINGRATYAEQAVVINATQDMTIYGGYVSCTSDISVDGTRATLDGGGGSSAPVLRITGAAGTTVQLNSLTIRNGDASPTEGEGGGIRYEGAGVLVVGYTSIINNSASKGGGIYANGSIDSALLQIGRDVTITGNTATRDGGGVFVNGMVMQMLAPNSIIAFNEALGQFGSKGYGGGLAVRSTGSRAATAFVGSTGVGSTGAIYGNEAKWGGGVAVSAGDDADDGINAMLRLYRTIPDTAAAIRGNFASQGGGAIYLWPNENFGAGSSYAWAHLWNAELTDNAAPEGAAVYSDNSSTADTTIGGFTILHPTQETRPPMPAAIGCPTTDYCNRVSSNIAVGADGIRTDGALFLVEDGGAFDLGRVLIEANLVGRLIEGEGSAYGLINDAVLTGNVVRRSLIQIRDDLTLHDSTIADNVIGEQIVVSTGDKDGHAFRRSIVWQPGATTLHATDIAGTGVPFVQSMIASEVASLHAGPNALVADPRFIDPDRGDYRLRAASRAVDFALPIAGDDRDAFNLPRDQRLPIVPRPPGRERDVGAFERTSLLPIVLNGDFSGDTNQWFLPIGHSGNFQTIDAPGSTGGAAQVADLTPSSAPRLLGYAQCIHIPGPGEYALNGSARSDGMTTSEHNRTALIWELRSDGGDGCIDGPITLGGEHTLGNSAGWQRPAQPARINVSPVAWTADTSLTVIFVVYPNVAGTFNGLFDRITLELADPLPASLFRSGFEGLGSRPASDR